MIQKNYSMNQEEDEEEDEDEDEEEGLMWLEGKPIQMWTPLTMNVWTTPMFVVFAINYAQKQNKEK